MKGNHPIYFEFLLKIHTSAFSRLPPHPHWRIDTFLIYPFTFRGWLAARSVVNVCPLCFFVQYKISLLWVDRLAFEKPSFYIGNSMS